MVVVVIVVVDVLETMALFQSFLFLCSRNTGVSMLLVYKAITGKDIT